MLTGMLLCLVVGISDGDTLTARCLTGDAAHPHRQVKVRVAEIDAPESGQPFDRRSKGHFSALCFETEATIRQTATDRYGRMVARVQCRGVDANLEQVRAGMAWAFTKYQTDSAFPKAEQAARAAGVGMWAQPGQTAPWQFRQQPFAAVPDETGCITGPRGGRYRLMADGTKRYGC
jgi:endonuclease YncB( thermonuclease family)